MVQEVVRHVVAGVSEHTTAERCSCDIPVPVKEGVGQLPERTDQGKEQRWRHDKPILVHGEVVVNAMKGEMQSYADSIIGEIAKVDCQFRFKGGLITSNLLIQVEQKSMQRVLNQRPKEDTEYPICYQI